MPQAPPLLLSGGELSLYSQMLFTIEVSRNLKKARQQIAEKTDNS